MMMTTTLRRVDKTPTCFGRRRVGNPRGARCHRVSCKSDGALDRVRFLELASGRLAFGGLLATSVVGNLTGASLLQQCATEAPFLAAFVAVVVAATAVAYPGGKIREEDAGYAFEKEMGRQSMVVLSLLAALEAALARA